MLSPLSTRSLSAVMMSSLLSKICWSNQASGLVGRVSQERWNKWSASLPTLGSSSLTHVLQEEKGRLLWLDVVSWGYAVRERE